MKQTLVFLGVVLLLLFMAIGKENFGTVLLCIVGAVVVLVIFNTSRETKRNSGQHYLRTNSATELSERQERLKDAFTFKYNNPFIIAEENKSARYIFIDFETTDLPADYIMPTAESLGVYPYIIQAAVLVFNDQHELVDQFGSIIKAPKHARFAPRAEEIHGISKSRSLSEGVDIINLFLFLKKHILGHSILIAHNIKFDDFMLKLECKRNKIRLPQIETFCTMIETVNLCAIEKPYGRSGFKWPKLKDLVSHTYNGGHTEELELNFHDAMTDIKLCAMCFFELGLYKKCS